MIEIGEKQRSRKEQLEMEILMAVASFTKDTGLMVMELKYVCHSHMRNGKCDGYMPTCSALAVCP